jgi:hypothetical protein
MDWIQLLSASDDSFCIIDVLNLLKSFKECQKNLLAMCRFGNRLTIIQRRLLLINPRIADFTAFDLMDWARWPATTRDKFKDRRDKYRKTYNSDVETAHRLVGDEVSHRRPPLEYDMEDYHNPRELLCKAFTNSKL